MILDDDLRRTLGSTPCRLLQFPCPDCGVLCTWARVDDAVHSVAGCICNYGRVQARMLEIQEGWEPYPPPG